MDGAVDGATGSVDSGARLGEGLCPAFLGTHLPLPFPGLGPWVSGPILTHLLSFPQVGNGRVPVTGLPGDLRTRIPTLPHPSEAQDK